ncbi:Ger(x)C family spore germination protein [Paenibacillus aestuarii]|uniref:Ger(X)C family spore germination protein n=1 Tax=Paenibacillus aestuarii TaxID=516965 RepID=A0ABW0K0N1_9BACL|nr:Ger(x)C family spore germination protein [Paenibacillus aestuarii]
MMRSAYILVISLGLLFLQTGCWDVKTIQDTNYVTALGFDYDKGRFIIYAQMLDFANVAKQEGGKAAMSGSIWVGKEEGVTIGDAFSNLYKTSQQRVFWGHVVAFVFTQRALEKGLQEFTDSITRYNETRFTQWVYGTSEPLERVFTVIPFFNLSPMASILAHPKESYRQRSYIAPTRMYRVVAMMREPGNNLVLPSLDIQKNTWDKNGKPEPKLEIGGMHAVNNESHVLYFPEHELEGMRWLTKFTSRTPVTLTAEGKPVFSAYVDNPKNEVKATVEGNLVSFDIHISCKAIIREIFNTLDDTTMKEKISELIEKEVRQTFDIGKKQDVDLLRLEHVLYRNNFGQWARLTDNGQKRLQDYQIHEVKVDVNIMHAGMYKMKKNQEKRGQPKQY